MKEKESKINKVQCLKAELSALKKLIDQLPEERIIERLGFESRISKIKKELLKYEKNV